MTNYPVQNIRCSNNLPLSVQSINVQRVVSGELAAHREHGAESVIKRLHVHAVGRARIRHFRPLSGYRGSHW